MLYNRVCKWIITNADPTDNDLQTDDVNNDSVQMIAYLELEDLPEVQNQIVSYALKVRIVAGSATVSAGNFIYHGTNKINGEEYDLPLEQLQGSPSSYPVRHPVWF